jgi:hypothetical protein
VKVKVGEQTYEHNRNSLLNSDAVTVKRQTGMTVPEFQQGLVDDDPDAVKALVFLLKRRAGEDPDWETLDFDHADLEYLPDEQVEEPGPKEAAPGN